MYDTTMRNLQHNAGKLNKLDEQIASQQRINRPSDNPVGFTNALNYRNILNSLGQLQTNMNDGEIYMNVLETAFASMSNIFERCGELAVRAANDTEDHQTRLFTNMEVRQGLEQLVSLSQAKHKDNYIFSGKWTNQPPYEIKNGSADYREAPSSVPVNPTAILPDDPRPFENTPSVTIQLFDGAYLDPNIKPHPDYPMVQRIIPGSVEIPGWNEKSHCPTDTEPDYEIDYVDGKITLLSERAKEAFYDPNTGAFVGPGPNMEFEYIYRNSIDMSGEIYREIDTGITIKINSNPDDLFGKSGDSFKEIISLMQGLWYNDQAQISKSIESVDTARKRTLAEQAVEGTRLNRLGIVFDRNEELEIANEGARSKIEGVDVAEALSEFALANAVYNASLQVAANIMQNSLLNYL
jgi:flagellar hook-associated protein 3 FlgL